MKISPGEIVASKYKIEKEIGEGATGIVYLAQDTILSKNTAIKFLRREYSLNVTQRKRFLNEARVASHFVHESVVAIREVSEWRGYLYIVMDYHEGRTLKQIIQERMLTKDEIYEISKQLLGCLESAHQKNVIHRDIKPSNIIIYYDSNQKMRIKILDFGLASCEEYQNNVSGGTLNYISPEQLLDDPVDHRSDLYSAAVSIYEMYTGVLPVSGSTANEFVYNLLDSNSYIREQPKRVLPPKLKKILLKGLASDPESRYQNAAHFCKDLKKHLKFSYDNIIVKASWVIAAVCLLWIISTFWNAYRSHLEYVDILTKSEQAYHEKKWQQAIDLARKSEEIQPSYQAKKIIRNSTFAKIKNNITLASTEEIADKKSKEILLQYTKFYQTMQQVNLSVGSEDYRKAIDLIEKYQGLKNHKELLQKQFLRLQNLFYIQNFESAIENKNTDAAKKWYDKFQHQLSPEQKQNMQKKIHRLNKKNSYEEAMLENDYWKAAKIARVYQQIPEWQAKYSAAQAALSKKLQNCIILSPTTGKIVSQRVVVVHVRVPQIVSYRYLRLNGVALRYGSGSFSAEVILEQGLQKINLEYWRGNTKQHIHEIVVNIDILPPKLKVTKHFIEDSNIFIEGTVEENSRVDTIFFGDYEAQPLNASFSKWQISFPLTGEEKSVLLTARDIAGNTTTFKYTFTSDETPPEIYIESPKENEQLFHNKLTVTGIVMDDSEIEEVTVMSKKVSQIKNGKWSIEIELPVNIKSRTTDIVAEAKDIWGNSKKTKVTVVARYLKWQDLSIYKKLDLYTEKVWGLCYDHEGKYLVGAGNDGKKVVWSTKNYKPISITSTVTVTSEHLKISPAIRFTASTFADVTGKSTPDFFHHSQVGGVWRVSHSDLYDRDLGDLIRFFDRHISCMALSPNGRFLAMGHHSGNLRIIDLHRRQYILHSNVHKGVILTLCYSPDGRWLASGGGDYKVKLWAIPKFYRKKLRERHVLSTHKMSITALAFSHNSAILAAGSKDKRISLWDVNRGQLIKKLSGHTAQIESVSFSPVDMTLCTASSQGEMFIWK